MENPSLKNQLSGWLRWLLMPFAAFIGGSVGAFLLAFLQWVGLKMHGGFSEDGWYFIYILPIVCSVTFGWLYVLITLNIAPHGKFIAGVVMTTILGVITAFGIVFLWSGPRNDTVEVVQSTLGSIASMVAAIVSLVSLKDEYNK